jgi:hypothetical protein
MAKVVLVLSYGDSLETETDHSPAALLRAARNHGGLELSGTLRQEGRAPEDFRGAVNVDHIVAIYAQKAR